MERAFTIFGEPLVVAVEQGGDKLRVRIGEETLTVDEHSIDDRYVTLRIGARSVRVPYARVGAHVHVAIAGESYEFVPQEEAESAREAGAFIPEITSPMPGKVLLVKVAAGDVVEPDQALLLLEAMKMEQTVRAPTHARVAEVRVEAGAMVGPGAVLVVLEPVEEAAAS
jgi:biotin carboxyl carrier protein